MMTSSGSGAYRVGGSLSSSNLSPLAPPFKVDKSLLKPNSTNQSVNYSDVPMYGSCFDPTPGQFWNSSSSSASNCVATESVVTNTNCSSSANMYGYRDSQSSTPSASVYYGSSNAVPAYDPFSYEPFPNRMSTNNDEVAKPYYPPYVPPPPQKNEYLGLGVGSGPSYDLLSYSGSAHISGHGSTQVDHQQTISGDDRYKPKWGLSWSGLNDIEHRKWTDYTQGFATNDLNNSKLSSNKSSLFADGSNKSQPFVDINVHPSADGSNSNHLFGDMSSKSHLKQGACVTQDLGLHGQVSTVKDKCFDIFGGGYSLGSLGIGQQDCKSSSECSRTRTSAFASVSKESPHLQEPVMESITSFRASQKADGSSPEDHFSKTGFYKFGCASTTSGSTFPMIVTKLPYGGSCSSVESTLSAAKLNYVGNDAANQSNSAVGYCSSYQMESQMPLGMKRQSSIRIRRPVPSSTAASSCQTGAAEDSRFDDKVVSEKRKISHELPSHLSFDCVNMEASDADAVYSVEKYSGGSDGHNPAEDSPCWKGASSNHFSPFGHSESATSDGFSKKIDRCISLSSQDIQNKSFFFNTNATKDFYSGKVTEATSLERPSDCTSNDSESCVSANPKSCYFDLNTGGGLQFDDDCHISMIECNTMSKSKADLDPKNSLPVQLNLKGKISSASISEISPSEKSCKGNPVAAESLSGLPSNIDNNHSSSLPVNEASAKAVCEDSDSKIDVSVLLRTMMNLSEIFRQYCFSNKVEVAGIQSVAIKQIVNNLNASMLMSGQALPTKMLSSPDSFLQKDFPAVQMVNDAEALAASVKLGRTTEDILDYFSFKDDRNPSEDANMTKAVKKLLSENLQEEETNQQKLLYKNLWLEAEASLCVMTAKARFLGMNTEIKRTDDVTKGRINPTSSNISADLHVGLATENKDSPLRSECPKSTITSQHNHIEAFHIPNPEVSTSHERSGSGKKGTCSPSLYVSKPVASGNDTDDSLTTSNANDVETCVMARYQILNNRVGCSYSPNYESKQFSDEPKCPSNLYDSGNGFHALGTMTNANDPDTSVFGGYQILKCLDDSSDYLNYEGEQSPGDENYLPGINSSCTDKALLDSRMSNSLGVTSECEASVIARFRIIQSRIDPSNSAVNGSSPSTAVAEDGTEVMSSSQQDFKIKKTLFGPYPELTQDEDVNTVYIGANGQAVSPIVKSSVIFEGWYDNDCSSSADWEHISSRDV